MREEYWDRMNFKEWVKEVPREITDDSLWTVEAYRLALFAAEVGWHDATKLMQDQRTRSLSDQLYRAWLHQRKHCRRLQPGIGQRPFVKSC